MSGTRSYLYFLKRHQFLCWRWVHKHQLAHALPFHKSFFRLQRSWNQNTNIKHSPTLSPAPCAGLSSCTLHTNVHISTEFWSWWCRPYVCRERRRITLRMKLWNTFRNSLLISEGESFTSDWCQQLWNHVAGWWCADKPLDDGMKTPCGWTSRVNTISRTFVPLVWWNRNCFSNLFFTSTVFFSCTCYFKKWWHNLLCIRGI